MSRALNKLTTRQISALRASGRHADGGGLYLRITPQGSRSWVFMTSKAGKRTEVGIGAAAAITLATARRLASEMREAVALGSDPRRVWIRHCADRSEVASQPSYATHVATTGPYRSGRPCVCSGCAAGRLTGTRPTGVSAAGSAGPRPSGSMPIFTVTPSGTSDGRRYLRPFLNPYVLDCGRRHPACRSLTGIARPRQSARRWSIELGPDGFE